MLSINLFVVHCQDNFLQLEYKKYLEEVVQVLEADPDFKQELDKMGEDAQKDLAVCYNNLLNTTINSIYNFIVFYRRNSTTCY